MPTFEAEYKKLNKEQRQAVDNIYGPLLVVAGPGTGKTQLLSMRVANILRLSDVLPRNILCLTFTDSAATAMRERLLSLIGVDAHKVAIHTFHSFGVEIINQYPEYFYNGARFSPSDDIFKIEVIGAILQSLPHNNPLVSTMNGKFVYLRDISQAVDYLKKAGLDPNNLKSLLEANQADIEKSEALLSKAFDVVRLSKSDLPKIKAATSKLPTSSSTGLPAPFEPLLEVLRSSLQLALEEAVSANTTKPVTAWKNEWLKRDENRRYVLKDREYNKKLEALCTVYERYQAELIKRERYDFSDMVLQVLAAIKNQPQLRYALQEQYQFFLVDEFQDTNDAQLQLLYLLVDNPVHEGKPDLMVVGDDDQAIYKFQGAEINNIINFWKTYPDLELVSLRQNYRSTQNILDLSRSVITAAETRLENIIKEAGKTLRSNSKQLGKTEFRQFVTQEHEYAWVADEIKKLLDKNVKPSGIAVIGRQHKYLEALMPHLRELDIPVSYERRRDILEEYHIAQLIDLVYTVHYLAKSEDAADEHLSRVLSYPFWGIKPAALWQLSLSAYRQRKTWMEAMLGSDDKQLVEIAGFLLECAAMAQSEPLEHVVDRLVGSVEGKNYTSPYKHYYFSQVKFDQQRGEYITFLSGLKALRDKLRSYRKQETVYISDFIDFIEIHKVNQMPIVDETPFVSSEEAVHVMTAHKAKGLEFETVFVINAQESVWASGRNRAQLKFPKNLPITPAGDAFDDQLRLFFVALTRAKKKLYLTGYEQDTQGKTSLLVPFIDHQLFEATDNAVDAATILERSWQSYHPLPKEADAAAVLKPVLDDYKLNVTHLNKFLDVSGGGPHSFLLESLLRFPQAAAPDASYGTAVHKTLYDAYQHLKKQKRLSPTRVIKLFEDHLQQQRLKSQDHEKYLARGKEELGSYLDQRYESFKPEHLVEISFSRQGVALNKARLSGQIDKMVLTQTDKKCKVYDYKTGDPLTNLERNSGYKAINAWKYKKQLCFYKILVENSRTWSDYQVDLGVLEFTKPLNGNVQLLEYEFDDEEIARTKQLIMAVWDRIQKLDFPDVSAYEPSIKGIKKFEDDLISA